MDTIDVGIARFSKHDGRVDALTLLPALGRVARVVFGQVEPVGEFILSELVTLILSPRIANAGVVIVPDTRMTKRFVRRRLKAKLHIATRTKNSPSTSHRDPRFGQWSMIEIVLIILVRIVGVTLECDVLAISIHIVAQPYPKIWLKDIAHVIP